MPSYFVELKTKGSELEEALEVTRKEITDLQRQEKNLTVNGHGLTF